MAAPGWDTQGRTLQSSHDEDFHQFLDMGSMGAMGGMEGMGGMGGMDEPFQFDYHDFQTGNSNTMVDQDARDHGDTHMGGTDNPMALLTTIAPPGSAQNQQPQQQQQHSQQLALSTATSHPSIPSMPSIPSQQMIQQPTTPNDALNDIDAQILFLQQKRMVHQQHHMHEQQAQQEAAFYARRGQVPPTPQSLEMPPNSGHFYSQDQRQQNVFDNRYQRMQEQQDMAFTPLVSPAVTPLDPHFQIDPSFTMPGAYFSPLTSPALHAQSESNSPYDHRNSISNHDSPREMDLESSGANAPVSIIDLSKKARRNNASRSKSKGGSVRQSPITKPQKKKTTPTPKMVSQVLTEVQEANHEGLEQMLPQSSIPASLSSGESENASVSPEALSDMPPPPPPNSKTKSAVNGSRATQQLPPPPPAPPQQQQQQQQQQQSAVASALPTHMHGKPSPATPASLMRLPSSSASGGSAPTNAQDLGATDQIESFELPESVNFPKSQSTPLLDTNSTPVQSPRTTHPTKSAPGFQPLPSPVFNHPPSTSSANASPNLGPGSTGPTTRRTPQLAPRGSKKRASVSSVHVSPALLPKISPHVKPLLPGTPGMPPDDSASQLLMSKSNYQNILEGNNVPGINYPTELSKNLTSKRTSHKIAEQGRRNRINTALQEIATLLPTPVSADGKDEEAEAAEKKEKATSTQTSKASTVELAIEYIKQLKQDVADATARAEKAESKLEASTSTEADS